MFISSFTNTLNHPKLKTNQEHRHTRQDQSKKKTISNVVISRLIYRVESLVFS